MLDKKHITLIFKSWICVLLINKTIFRTKLDIKLYYIMRHLGIAIKSHYLKLIFKSKRLIFGIWGAITFMPKGLIKFLAKKPNDTENLC